MAEGTLERAWLRMGRAFDYVLGRNTLIGFASIMLLLISGYATWHGMRDFIVGVAQSSRPQAAGGGLVSSDDALVIAIVVALTFLMWLALRETFGARRKLGDRIICGLLYFFLAIWSIGFGYGFWWSLISGQEATRTGLAGLQEDARDAAQVVSARLDAVRGQIDSVVAWSDGQMQREETAGGSCGRPSGAGRGPLYNARRGVRDSVTTLRDGMVRSWLEPVKADVEQLRQAALSIEGGTVEARQKAFEARASDIRGRARNIASRSNELGKSTAAEMRALAAGVAMAPDRPGFTCHDATLAQRLLQAAEQADQPAVLKLREAVFNEGPAGVANAVKNLWRNMGVYVGSLWTYLGGNEVRRHTEQGEPITGRDLIALLATIGVDLGLLVLAILNPPPAETRRLSGKEERDIQSAILAAIQGVPGASMNWVRHHLVHHNETSYLVIPNLYSADQSNQAECERALAMNQLGGILADMDLVRWPEKARFWPLRGRPEPAWWPLGHSELRRLKHEETQGSDTDLTELRKGWIKKVGEDQLSERDKVFLQQRPLRNHGLFSKAERALSIAGWSEAARRDVEIFPLIDSDGLTPLLQALSHDAEARAETAARPAARGPGASAPISR